MRIEHMDGIKFIDNFKKIDADINSVLENYTGAAYDSKARMYEKLVSKKIYNKIIWGTSPDDYKEFAHQAINSSDGLLLDAGCGGLIQTADIYLKTKRQCVLVDNSSEMLKIARGRLIQQNGKLGDHIRLLQADVFTLPFPDQVFDTT